MKDRKGKFGQDYKIYRIGGGRESRGSGAFPNEIWSEGPLPARFARPGNK